MGNSPLVRLSEVFQTTREESWMERVKQNARTFFELRGTTALAQSGAGAFDLLELRPAAGTRQRQAASLLMHVIVIALMLLVGKHVASKLPPAHDIFRKNGWTIYRPPETASRTVKPGGKDGSGGHLGDKLPTAGEFAARSQIVLLHPRVPDSEEHILVVEPKVFDANVNDPRRVPQIGLPTMKERNDSNGPGKNEGIGINGPGNSIGIDGEDGEGEKGNGERPAYGTDPVKCVYCPDPEYTDEARHEKLQGSVTLRVLVTADGRAGQVRIIKGLGLGLDERAADMVRKWRFEPARDAGRKAIAEWVTVEATYRLF